MDVILLTGPPRDPSRDEEWLSHFLGLPGRRIVAGGTTAEIISRRIGEEVVVHLESQRAGIPPWGELKGVELVTEGVITLEAVLNNWKENEGASEPENREPSAAEKMSVLLKQAETVTIVSGSGTQRNELIERLSRLLRAEGKAVIINRY